MAFKRRQGAQLGAPLGAPLLGRALSLSLALAFSLLSLQSGVGFLLGPRRAALTSLAVPLVAAPGVAWAESLELKSPKSIKELAAGSKKLEDALRPGIQKLQRLRREPTPSQCSWKVGAPSGSGLLSGLVWRLQGHGSQATKDPGGGRQGGGVRHARRVLCRSRLGTRFLVYSREGLVFFKVWARGPSCFDSELGLDSHFASPLWETRARLALGC